uniref:Galactose-3-O-sulfotransferase 3 n=1 Tax=Bos mutus grunniens TaxID=30521 RepID=A0A8B9XZE1_BOSMU
MSCGGRGTGVPILAISCCRSCSSNTAARLCRTLRRPKHMTVAFLKTHKTAGTTVQNILFRFAERHNLTVALPHPSCEHQFCYPRNFRRAVHRPRGRRTCWPATCARPRGAAAPHAARHRLRHHPARASRHVRVALQLLQPVLPAFRRVPNASLEAFLRARGLLPRGRALRHVRAQHPGLRPGRRQRAQPRDDDAYLAGLIRQVEEVFARHDRRVLDESLVLLRRLLAWDLDDVLYARLNARAASSRPPPSPRRRAGCARLERADAGLYDHFNATFWRRVASAGRACVEREARELREARERLLRRCFGDEPVLRPRPRSAPSSCSRGSPAARWTSWATTCPAAAVQPPRPASSWPCLRCSTQATCCASRSAEEACARPNRPRQPLLGPSGAAPRPLSSRWESGS